MGSRGREPHRGGGRRRSHRRRGRPRARRRPADRVEAGVRRPARRRDPRRLADADGDGARRHAPRAAAARAPRRRCTELHGHRRAAACTCSPAPATTTSTCSPRRPSSSASARASPPEDYPLLEPLRDALGAELAATRKVTDRGWLPRARQVGITGRSIAPRLYVVLGASGKFNHMVGVRAAAHRARGQHRPGRAGLRRRRRRDRGRLARGRARCSSHEIAAARPADVTDAPTRRVTRALALAVVALRRAAQQLERRDQPQPTEAAAAGDVRRLPGARARARSTPRPPARSPSPEMDETSGLVVSAKNPDTLWTNNDSGDSARVFAISPTGALRGIYPLDGATALDWEDIAIGPGPQREDAVPLRRRHRRQRARAARTSSCTASPSRRSSATVARTRSTASTRSRCSTPTVRTTPRRSWSIRARATSTSSSSTSPAARPRSTARPAGSPRASTTVLERVGEVQLPASGCSTRSPRPTSRATAAPSASAPTAASGSGTAATEQTVIAALAAKPCEGPIPFEIQGETLGLAPGGRGYFTVSEGVNVPLHRVHRPGAVEAAQVARTADDSTTLRGHHGWENAAKADADSARPLLAVVTVGRRSWRRARPRSSRPPATASSSRSTPGTLQDPALRRGLRARRQRPEPGHALGQQRLGRHRPALRDRRGRRDPGRSTPLTGATAIDWEDMALGAGPVAGQSYLYVGDIGDNAGSRGRTSSSTGSPSRS